MTKVRISAVLWTLCPERAARTSTAPTPSSWSPQARPITASAARNGWTSSAKAAEDCRQVSPAVTTATAAILPAGDSRSAMLAAGRPHVIRQKMPLTGTTTFHRCRLRRRSRSTTASWRTRSCSSRTASRPTISPMWSTTTSWRSPMSSADPNTCPRRPNTICCTRLSAGRSRPMSTCR